MAPRLLPHSSWPISWCVGNVPLQEGGLRGQQPTQMGTGGGVGTSFKTQKPRQLGAIKSQHGNINIKKTISLILGLLKCFPASLTSKRNRIPRTSKLQAMHGRAAELAVSHSGFWAHRALPGWFLCHGISATKPAQVHGYFSQHRDELGGRQRGLPGNQGSSETEICPSTPECKL